MEIGDADGDAEGDVLGLVRGLSDGVELGSALSLPEILITQAVVQLNPSLPLSFPSSQSSPMSICPLPHREVPVVVPSIMVPTFSSWLCPAGITKMLYAVPGERLLIFTVVTSSGKYDFAILKY